MNRVIEQSISLERMEDTASLFGPFDENIRLIERELHVQIVIREEELRISGEAEQVMYAEKTIQSLLALGARGEAINEQNIRYVLQLCSKDRRRRSTTWHGTWSASPLPESPSRPRRWGDRLRPCHPE